MRMSVGTNGRPAGRTAGRGGRRRGGARWCRWTRGGCVDPIPGELTSLPSLTRRWGRYLFWCWQEATATRATIAAYSRTGRPLPELVGYSPDRPCTRGTCRRAGRESVSPRGCSCRLLSAFRLGGASITEGHAFVTRSAGRLPTNPERLVSASASRRLGTSPSSDRFGSRGRVKVRPRDDIFRRPKQPER